MYRPTVFDIPRKPEELPSANEAQANARYQPVSASKDVSGDQFAQGVHQFRFDTSGNTWFIPSMSYLRLRCTLSQVRLDGGQPLPILAGGTVAPNMGLAANLFKSMAIQLQGKTIERLAERAPQIDALKIRTHNTGAWLNSVGQDTNFWAADIHTRREQVAVNGYLNRGRTRMPCYGPQQPQEHAGFDQDHLISYNGTTHILTFDENGESKIDLEHGSMALRPGDRFGRGRFLVEIDHVVDRTHAYAHYVQTNAVGRGHIGEAGNPDDGLNGWYVQELHLATNNDSPTSNEFEILWQPPLGFFNVQHGIPPGGQWTLELTPQNAVDFKRLAVETLAGTNARIVRPGQPTLAGDVDFQVHDMQLYVYTMESNRFDHGTWFLDIEHTNCQLQHLPSDCTGLVTRNFDVHGRSHRLALAFQDQNAGSDTQYSRSKFKIRPGSNHGVDGQSTAGGQDLLLERFFIQYGREQKPSPDFDGRYAMTHGHTRDPQVNYLMQRYVDSLMQADLYHTDGGAESFKEWVERGPLYFFRWPKDAMEQSTRAAVSVKFAHPFADNRQHQVVLFNQWRTAYRIVHRQGRMEVDDMHEF